MKSTIVNAWRMECLLDAALPRSSLKVVILLLLLANVPGARSKTSQFFDQSAQEQQKPGRTRSKAVVVGKSVPTAMSFSPNGEILAIGTSQGDVALCDASNGRFRLTLGKHEGLINHIVFSADGKMLATGGYDDEVKLWDVTTGGLRANLNGHKTSVLSISFSPDGKVLATAGFGNKRVFIWNVATGQRITTIPEGPEPVYPQSRGILSDVIGSVLKRPSSVFSQYEFFTNASISPDGKLLEITTNSAMYLWDISSRALVRKLGQHASTIYVSTFSPNGKLIASGSRDWTAKLWEVATGELKATLEHNGRLNQIVFTPDGRTIVTGCGEDDMMVRAWDVATGRLRVTRGDKGSLWSLASPDGRIILTKRKADKVTQVWDAATGRLRMELDGAGDPVIAFSPDGRILAIAGHKKTVLLWDVPAN